MKCKFQSTNKSSCPLCLWIVLYFSCTKALFLYSFYRTFSVRAVHGVKGIRPPLFLCLEEHNAPSEDKSLVFLFIKVAFIFPTNQYFPPFLGNGHHSACAMGLNGLFLFEKQIIINSPVTEGANYDLHGQLNSIKHKFSHFCFLKNV